MLRMYVFWKNINYSPQHDQIKIAQLVEEENSKYKPSSFTNSPLPAATPFTAITNAVFNVLRLAAYVAIVIKDCKFLLLYLRF